MKEAILAACLSYKGLTISGFDLPAILYATAVVESSLGANTTPRYEAHWDVGGSAFNKSKSQEWLRGLITRHGKFAVSSMGPFQVLYFRAAELGYKGTPSGLEDPHAGALYAVADYRDKVRRFGDFKTLEDAYDAYNTGNHRDANRPSASTFARFRSAYEEFLKKNLPPMSGKGASSSGSLRCPSCSASLAWSLSVRSEGGGK